MAEGCIVADTGPLLALARLDGLKWLPELFGSVLIPQSVLDEALYHPDKPDARQITNALASDERFRICADVGDPRLEQEPLDRGERSAISLALQGLHRVLLDDREARIVARGLNLPVVGTLGVLILARHRGKIDAVAPLIRKLTDSGYYLGPALIEATLRAVSEH